MNPDEVVWQQIATKNGCRFLGIQTDIHGKQWPTFNEDSTGGSFMLHDGETVEMAVKRVKEKFSPYQATCPECGFICMSDEVKYGRCSCGERVRRAE